MTIHQRQVLTVSAESYVKSRGAELQNYDMMGVRGDNLEKLCRSVPDGAEAVVDLRPTYAGGSTSKEECLYGTALTKKSSWKRRLEA